MENAIWPNYPIGRAEMVFSGVLIGLKMIKFIQTASGLLSRFHFKQERGENLSIQHQQSGASNHGFF
jgi:hypothetical protein